MIRAAQVPNLSDSHSLSFLLNGLQADVRVRLRSHETTDIFRTMLLAREVERELLITCPHTYHSPFLQRKLKNPLGLGTVPLTPSLRPPHLNFQVHLRPSPP